MKIPESTITDQRRVVFISVIGLYSSWKQCPASVLYAAIFMLPMKRRWIFQATKYEHEFQQSVVGQLLQCGLLQRDGSSWEQFTRLLRWKDSQNMVFWMLDGEITDADRQRMEQSLIAPIWHHINERLTKWKDPVTNTTYEPLKLDEKWWKSTYRQHVQQKYGTSVSCVLAELFFAQLRYEAIKEILHQSNPRSFRVVHSCHDLTAVDNIMDENGDISPMRGFYVDETLNDNGQGHGVWMISREYDTESN